MLKSVLAAFCVIAAAASPVKAIDFVPEDFGIVQADKEGKVKEPSNVYCVFHQKSFNANYYRCNDGSMRYGKTNEWEQPPEVDTFLEKTPLPFDGTLKVPGKVLIRVEGYINDGYIRYDGGKSRKAHYVDRYVLSFSYLLVDDMETCQRLAPKMAYNQYLAWKAKRDDISVQYFCD